MEFNDGSQYRTVTDPAAQLAQRDLFGFRAASARNGVPYTDAAFAQHRRDLAGMRGLLMYQFVWQNAGPPEAQADYLIATLGGGLRSNEMVMVDPEAASGLTDPAGFVRRWLARVEGALDCRAWIYVPGALSQALQPVTEDRIVMAPRYSGGPQRGKAPDWPWDVHQYTDRGPFPGCSSPGDTSFTALTVTQLLGRCNPHGTATPCPL